MKKDIHPTNYRDVAFKDVTSGKVFILKSTANSSEKIEVDGKEYPVFTVDTSSASHPFYTGNRSSAKATGRVERFNRMYKKPAPKAAAKPAAKAPAKKAPAKAAAKPAAKAPAKAAAKAPAKAPAKKPAAKPAAKAPAKK